MVWHITPSGNFEGKSIPNFLGTADFDREPEGMAALRERVYAYRLGRTALHRDDKVLAAWNGLALAALARAGLALNEPRYLDAARRTAEFLASSLTAPDGRLLARWRDGNAAHAGKLDDYAFYAYGLLELYGAAFDPVYLIRAAELAERLLELFFDWKQGGFYPYASDGEQLLTRTKEATMGPCRRGTPWRRWCCPGWPGSPARGAGGRRRSSSFPGWRGRPGTTRSDTALPC